jgi:hypothetical protein
MENFRNSKYIIELLDMDDNVRVIEYCNNLKDFARRHNVSYYLVRSLVNVDQTKLKRGYNKQNKNVSKQIKIIENPEYQTILF